MKELRCLFLGFGNAARAFLRILADRESDLACTYGARLMIVGIATRRMGRCLFPAGVTPRALHEHLAATGDFPDFVAFDGDSAEFVSRCPADVAFEMTPLNVASGEPAVSHVRAALASGKHAISANKGPLIFGFRRTRELAKEAGRRFLYETTVMDGAPVFNLVERCLPGCKVLGFTGVLNSTTNYILDRMAEGAEFEEALRTAQECGFAEADASLDIEGWDSACKTAALMNVWMDAEVSPAEVRREGISGVDARTVRDLRSRGISLRLVCRASMLGGRPVGEVVLLEVPEYSQLAQVKGTSSLLTIRTDLMGDITLTEHDPAIQQTGYGLYSDLLRLLTEGAKNRTGR
ncbi:MAG: hypothetical protein AB1497_10035 [Bacillota bacterium]